MWSDGEHSPSPLVLCFLCRLERLPLLHGKPVCFRQSSIALSMCRCVCVCQRIGAHQLAGCILDHLIHRLILCSFAVASSPWPDARSFVVILFFSPSYFASVRFRTPVVPPWFLLCVKNNPTYSRHEARRQRNRKMRRSELAKAMASAIDRIVSAREGTGALDRAIEAIDDTIGRCSEKDATSYLEAY